MRNRVFCGFLRDEQAIPEVREAFRVLAQAGLPFWHPGPARGDPMVRGVSPSGEAGYFWWLLGAEAPDLRVLEEALEQACRLLAAYVPLIREGEVSMVREYRAEDLEWLKERLLKEAWLRVGTWPAPVAEEVRSGE